MKILALETKSRNAAPEDFQKHLQAEARRVWQLQQDGILREIYFRGDRSDAVLILECEFLEEAEEVLASLPLSEAGLITFELIPLVPYPGFARLFNTD